jgi:hypothetical protein
MLTSLAACLPGQGADAEAQDDCAGCEAEARAESWIKRRTSQQLEVERLLRILAQRAGAEQADVESLLFHVASEEDEREPNAWLDQIGEEGPEIYRIVVTYPLIRPLTSDADLACTLLHEIGHYRRRRVNPTEAIEKDCIALQETGGDAFEICWHNKYLPARRAEEFAADDYVAEAAAAATPRIYDPWRCVALMRQESDLEAGTHPLPAERVTRLEAALRQKGIAPGVRGSGYPEDDLIRQVKEKHRAQP